MGAHFFIQILLMHTHTQASEVNDPTKTDTTRVQITIFDINDHSPVFLQNAYSANISESQALQTTLVTVTAMDRDFVSIALSIVCTGTTIISSIYFVGNQC